jgi:predicted regulator of Ras-like GTPase activity (Roadblock/LC7/MglB family)
MFKQLLQEVVDNVDGGMAGLLMGFDGIPVDHYVPDGGDRSGVETVGAEYSIILKQINTAAEMLEVGKAEEVAIRAERMNTVIRMLNEEFFVAITLHPHGNLGKARFLLRTRAARLLAELE